MSQGVTSSLRPAQTASAPERLAQWREGRTGQPLVDAGMRELAATGWLFARLPGSFLPEEDQGYALAIVQRYGIELPATVLQALTSGAGESIKPADPRVAHIDTRMVAAPQQALEARHKRWVGRGTVRTLLGRGVGPTLAGFGVTDIVLLEKGDLAGGSTSKSAGGHCGSSRLSASTSRCWFLRSAMWPKESRRKESRGIRSFARRS